MQLDSLFEHIWQGYIKVNPDIVTLHQALSAIEPIQNDHIALRTFADSPCDLNHIEKWISSIGYQENGQYVFIDKHLTAKSYFHSLEQPLIFVSQIHLNELSQQAQDLLYPLIQNLADFSPEMLWQSRPWPAIKYSDYQLLAKESEYASWLACHGIVANHFTVAVHKLSQFKDLQGVCDFVEQQGFTMNHSGGLIKGSPDKGLCQASTMANLIDYEFADQLAKIPGCYYEFAQRYAINGQLFLGFEAKNANHIFESTNRR